jgi:hypothetical protein
VTGLGKPRREAYSAAAAALSPSPAAPTQPPPHPSGIATRAVPGIAFAERDTGKKTVLSARSDGEKSCWSHERPRKSPGQEMTEAEIDDALLSDQRAKRRTVWGKEREHEVPS